MVKIHKHWRLEGMTRWQREEGMTLEVGTLSSSSSRETLCWCRSVPGKVPNISFGSLFGKNCRFWLQPRFKDGPQLRQDFCLYTDTSPDIKTTSSSLLLLRQPFIAEGFFLSFGLGFFMTSSGRVPNNMLWHEQFSRCLQWTGFPEFLVPSVENAAGQWVSLFGTSKDKTTIVS